LGFQSCLGFKKEKVRDLHLLLDVPYLEELGDRLVTLANTMLSFDAEICPVCWNFFFPAQVVAMLCNLHLPSKPSWFDICT